MLSFVLIVSQSILSGFLGKWLFWPHTIKAVCVSFQGSFFSLFSLSRGLARIPVMAGRLASPCWPRFLEDSSC